MNKQELIDTVAKNEGITKAMAARVLDGYLYSVSCALKDGDEVKLVNFGTFKASQQPARTARNPATGEAVKVPAKKRVSFVAGKGLKEAVNYRLISR